MDDRSDTDASLREVRRDIDAIDLQLLEALQKRFALIDRVLQAKSATANQSVVAMRPAREAQIVRHLLEVNDGAVPDRLVVRLWREIISRATLLQANLRVHATRAAMSCDEARLLVRDQFCEAHLELHDSIIEALDAVAVSREHVAVMAIAENWLHPYRAGAAGDAKVIAALPTVAVEPVPRLLVLGHSPATVSGEDETLVVTGRAIPAAFSPQPLWRRETGEGLHLAALPGFLPGNIVACGAPGQNEELALQVLGRYPSRLTITG